MSSDSASPPKESAHEVFKHGDFVRFQTARFFSVIAMQMQAVAVGWQVYAMSSRPLDLGYVGLAIFVPFVVVALFAGDVADRYDRRKILVYCYVALTLCSGLLLFHSFQPTNSVAPIYAILAMLGAARAFTQPAAASLLPHLIPLQLFGRAVAWSSSVFTFATIAGPALGGVLYGLGGAGLVYGSCIALMAISLLLTLSLKVHSKVHAVSGLRTLARLTAGISFVRKKKIVLGAISLDLFAVLFGGAVALLPVFAKDILHVGPFGFGLMRSAPAVGAAIMAVWLAYFPLQRHVGMKMFIAVGIFGLATCAFGLSTNFVLSLVSLVIIGATDMISVVVRQTLIQLGTPDEMRGRVSAVNYVFIGASNELGEFESGFTADLMGTVPAVVVGGICTCLVVAIWGVFFPDLRKADRFSEETVDSAV